MLSGCFDDRLISFHGGCLMYRGVLNDLPDNNLWFNFGCPLDTYPYVRSTSTSQFGITGLKLWWTYVRITKNSNDAVWWTSLTCEHRWRHVCQGVVDNCQFHEVFGQTVDGGVNHAGLGISENDKKNGDQCMNLCFVCEEGRTEWVLNFVSARGLI